MPRWKAWRTEALASSSDTAPKTLPRGEAPKPTELSLRPVLPSGRSSSFECGKAIVLQSYKWVLDSEMKEWIFLGIKGNEWEKEFSGKCNGEKENKKETVWGSLEVRPGLIMTLANQRLSDVYLEWEHHGPCCRFIFYLFIVLIIFYYYHQYFTCLMVHAVM